MKFNPDVLDCAPAPIAEAWSWVDGRDDLDLLDVCQAVPNYPPHQSLLDYLGGALKAGEATTYTDIVGILPLREALAEDINSRYHANVGQQDIVITAGCNQGFCAVVDTLCRTGDNVILASPCYFNYPMWFTMRGIETRWLEFNPETAIPFPENVADLVDHKTRALVLISPNNPTGAIYPPQTIAEFHQAASRSGIPLVLDETYRDFMDGSRPPHDLLAEDGWKDSFIHLYSFSKAFSLTGHRVGAVVAGPPVVKQLTKLQDCIVISAPHSGQLAALYGLDHLKAWRTEKGNEMIARAQAIESAFDDPRLRYRAICAGAYFTYIEHPFEQDAHSVAHRLATEFGVVSLPGNYFGNRQDRFLRFAFANLDAQRFPELVERLISSQP